VQTLRTFAERLASADSLDSLGILAADVGCTGKPAPLDLDTRRALGLEHEVSDARIAAGTGALRALLVEVTSRDSIREVLPRIAGRVSTRAPHVLWMLIATHRESRTLAVAAWTDDRRPVRVAALVVDRARVVDSDAETLRALCAASSDRDVLTHSRWVEILGREALGIRFYRALERAVDGLARSSDSGPTNVRAEIALLDTSRLLFLSFLQAKGWLDGDAAFLVHQYERCVGARLGFHHRVLRPLFFGTLNTPLKQRAAVARSFGRIPFLNGGLFAQTAVERRHRGVSFSDDAYGRLIYDVFEQYRFTAREESSTWSEAAIDPEMLGKAFESLMASSDRSRTGAFFTPFSLVERVATAGLSTVLGVDAGADLSLSDSERTDLATRIDALTILDPACGSGAFLVHALERLSGIRARIGDMRPMSDIRRDVLTRSIFGVDINPTAVWLCELRLWLSVVIESDETDPARLMPLPNLDRNIRVGDSLSGRAFGETDLTLRGGGTLWRLRRRYAAASGARKDSLARQLDKAERDRAILSLDIEIASVRDKRHDLVMARRGRDLFGARYTESRDERVTALTLRERGTSLRALRAQLVKGGALPFAFPTHFGDIASRGGFGLVIGNPPWVRLHKIPVNQRSAFRRDFDVARHAAWQPGTGPSGAGHGFAAQIDLSAIFIERATRLLAPGGGLSLLVPAKLWRSLAGGGVRRWVAAELTLRAIEDFTNAPTVFDAAVYPSLLVAHRAQMHDGLGEQPIDVSVSHSACEEVRWSAPWSSIPFDASVGAPWILLPPDARRAFDRLRRQSTTLTGSPLSRPHLGVKCGCNDAFIVELLDTDGDVATVKTSKGRNAVIERSMLRPLLRGDRVRRWIVPQLPEHIVWTHDDLGTALAKLPPKGAAHFSGWRRDLVKRTDARRTSRWWSLFRIEGARNDVPRVVWSDIGREPRAAVLRSGDRTVPLNSCYVVRCPSIADAFAFATLLNSPLARAWLRAVAEPARGGYSRFMGWVMSLLPIPCDWDRAVQILAPIGARSCAGQPAGDNELFEASLEAYHIRRGDVEPLVEWMST
jgi:hypothetical protein